ncbi:MAG: hypothetical protein WC246_00395 [Candidatus Paceibacterota bacterium]|jgi:hypothetical protein
MTMKKIIALAALALLVVPFVAQPAFAQVTPGQVPGPIVAQTGPTSVSDAVGWIITIVQWFYTIIFILAVFFILLSAFYFITSGGDAEKTAKAKSTLLYAVIGIAVGLLSYGIVTFVQSSIQNRVG